MPDSKAAPKLVSCSWEPFLAGVLSSFFTAFLLISLDYRSTPPPSSLPSAGAGGGGGDPHRQLGSGASAESRASGTRIGHPSDTASCACSPGASQTRFQLDPYPVPGPIPWEQLSKKTQADFTLNGTIQVASWYNTPPAEGARPDWSTAVIDRYVYLVDAKEYYVGTRLSPFGPDTNNMFFQALDAFPVMGKSVLVVGSDSPWVEAFCISYGASRITSVGLNGPVPLVNNTRIRAVSAAELEATDETFDAIFSYSSLEHDGLGRYGDPLNPFGDIERMRKLRGLIRPQGRFYLGVTNGRDGVHFNAHRIYGRIRFPMLIQGWKLEKTFGPYSLEQHYTMAPFAYLQPLHVLTPQNAGS